MDLWFESYRFLEERPLREDERRELIALERQHTLYLASVTTSVLLGGVGMISVQITLNETGATIAWMIFATWISLLLWNRSQASLRAVRDLREARVRVFERIVDVAHTDLRSDIGEDAELEPNQTFEIFEGAPIVEALAPSGRVVHMEGRPRPNGFVSAVEIASVYPVEKPEAETRDLTPEEIEELNRRIDTENGTPWSVIGVCFVLFFVGAYLLANHRIFPGFWPAWLLTIAALWYTTSTRNTASRYRRTMGLALEEGHVEVMEHKHGWQERLPYSNWPWTLNGWPARWRRS